MILQCEYRFHKHKLPDLPIQTILGIIQSLWHKFD